MIRLLTGFATKLTTHVRIIKDQKIERRSSSFVAPSFPWQLHAVLCVGGVVCYAAHAPSLLLWCCFWGCCWGNVVVVWWCCRGAVVVAGVFWGLLFGCVLWCEVVEVFFCDVVRVVSEAGLLSCVGLLEFVLVSDSSAPSL